MPTNDDTPTIDSILLKLDNEIDRSEVENRGDIAVFAYDEAKAAIQNLIDRARLDELTVLINRLNVYEEYKPEPNKALKHPNHMILNRIKALETKIKEGE